MKKQLWLILPVLGLLASCGENSSITPSSTVPENDSSVTSNQIVDRFDQSTNFYAIDMDYIMTYEGSRVSTGVESKKVYLGKDKDGFDVKVEFMIGYFTSISSLENNSKEETTSYSIYHSPNKTYTLMPDSSYKVQDANHDIKPYLCPFDFAKLTAMEEEQDGFETIVSAKVADADVSSFLGNSIKDSSNITNMECSLTFYASDATLEEVTLSYKKGSYSLRQTFSFDTTNSLLALPA